MKLACSIAALTLLCSATFSFANEAPTDEFYVVQDAATKKCSVVNAKPTSAASVVVSGADALKSQAEADAAMPKIAACAPAK